MYALNGADIDHINIIAEIQLKFSQMFNFSSLT